MLKKFLVVTVFLLAGAAIVQAANYEESLTISTYYPSPYGVYRNLKLNPTDAIPAAPFLSRGVMYYDASDDMIKYYAGTGINAHWVNLTESASGYWAYNATSHDIYKTNSGQVGIGTSSPGYLLDVSGTVSTGIRYRRTDAKDARIAVVDPTETWYLASGLGNAGDFSIAQNGPVNRLVVTQAGYVGIGTSSAQPPRGRLEVAGGIRVNRGNTLAPPNSDSTNAGYTFDGNGDTGMFAVGGDEWMGSDLVFKTDNAERMRLHVNDGGTGNNIIMTVNGYAQQLGGRTTWAAPSDVRLKKNIVNIDGALGKMLSLRGVNFEWKDAERAKLSPGPQLGMIAQEVEKVFPDWVGNDPQGNKFIIISGFEALTVESMRQLKKDNDELRERVRSLEEKLAKVK